MNHCIAWPQVCSEVSRRGVVLLPRVPAGYEDAGSVLSVNELTVCLGARTWQYFLNCSQTAGQSRSSKQCA